MNEQDRLSYKEKIKKEVLNEIENNYLPSSETLLRLENADIKFETIDHKLDVNTSEHEEIKKSLTEIKEILKDYQPIVKEIRDWKTALKIGGIMSGTLVKVIIGFGIIVGGVLGLKEWFKK